MLNKLKQQTQRWSLAPSNRLPSRRARHFLVNYMRMVRFNAPSAPLRAAIGLVRWADADSFYGEDRISFRAGCFITGRARGTSQRFTVARTCVKHLTAAGKLFGVKKSSW
jgi:ribosomal protein S14